MATTSQWWLRTIDSSTLSATATRFHSILGGPATGGDSTEANLQAPVSAAGNLLTLRVDTTVAPGTGKSFRFQVSINGTPSGTLDVTISDAATSATATGTVAISAGDLITVKCVPSGTPSKGNVQVAIEFDPTTANNYCYPVGGTSGFTTAPQYERALGGLPAFAGSDSLATLTKDIVPFAGTLTAFYVALTTAPGGATSWDLVVVRNGSEEASSVVNISGSNKTGNVTGLSISVAAGDVLTFKVKAKNGAASTPTRAGHCVTIVPSTPGLFAISGASGSSLGTAARYLLQGGAGTPAIDATEANVQMHRAPASLKFVSMYVLATAPGAGQTRTFTQRVNSSNGNLTITLSGGSATSGNDTGHSDTLSAGDLFDIGYTASASAASSVANAWAVAVTTSLGSPQSITLPLIGPTSAVYAPSLNFHSSGLVVAVGHRASPYLSVYVWKSIGGLGGRYAPPSPALSAMASSPCFHPSALAIAFVSGGELHVWHWDMVTGFGSRYANPSPIPAHINNVAWSPNGRAILISHDSPPYVSAYAWSVAGFGAKYSAPAQTPSGEPHSIAWHPSSNAIGVGFLGTPYFYAWAFDTVTGWGARYAPPPLPVPATIGGQMAWSRDGTKVTIGFAFSPRAYTWDWAPGFSGTAVPVDPIPAGVVMDAMWSPEALQLLLALSFGTPSHAVSAAAVVYDYGTPFEAFSDPGDFPDPGPGAFAAGAAWHPQATDIVVTMDGEPYIRAWPWDSGSGWGTAYADPPEQPEADDDPDTYPPPLVSKPAWGGLLPQDIDLPLIGPTGVVYGIRVGDVIELPLIESTARIYGIEVRPAYEIPTPLGEVARTLEIEFEPGVWTDVSDHFDSASSLDWHRGVDESRDPVVGTMSFDLSNNSEDFTQGLRDAPWWNLLLPGIGVRYGITYENVSYPRFRGSITDIKPAFGTEGSDDHRISLDCESSTGVLARTDKYTITTLSNSDVDQCIANVIEAPQFEKDGVTAISYLLDDSSQVLPYFWQRGNALADIVAAAQCGLGDVVWEDGSGRIRLTSVENLLGKYATPAHMWGTIVSPDDAVEPDWRWTSQAARQSITTQVIEAGIGTSDLYEHPYNSSNELSPPILQYHAILITGQFETVPLTVSPFGVDSVIEANSDPDGGGTPELIDATLYVDGTNFTVIARNHDSPLIYMTSLIIKGTGFVVSSHGRPAITYEKAIPYIAGMPEAEAIDLPYLEQSEATLAYAQGKMRGNRVPAPWLNLTFTVDSDEKARSLFRAEINDLVLYDGTGQFRERIRDWYRIQSIAETVSSEALVEYAIQLAPAHLIRDPHHCAYSSFVTGDVGNTLSDIGFEIGTVAEGDDWIVGAGALTPAVLTPDPVLTNLTGGDQSVIVQWENMLGTFVATGDDEGGLGCVFRANSDGSQRWEVRFDNDQTRIVVWNTVDGIVGSYDWTPTDSGELEARPLADRIRIFLNARPEPIIDLPGRARFQSNTYAGICAKISGFNDSLAYVSDFCAQRC